MDQLGKYVADAVLGIDTLWGGDVMKRLRKILHISLLQQLQVVLDNLFGHLHTLPALLQPRLGSRAEVFRGGGGILAILAMTRIYMRQFRLLRHNLDQQALAQVSGSYSGWIEVLHHVNTPPYQSAQSFLVTLVVFRELAECINEFVLASRQVTIFVKISDYEVSGKFKRRFKRHCSQLPRQVIGQSGRLRKKVFE